jgi:glycosyltransferase involved in cell wall biosynthesis
MKKLLFLTHENLEKTAVAKAMFFDVAKSLSSSTDVTFISASDNASYNGQKVGGVRMEYFSRNSQGKISKTDFALLLRSYFNIIKLVKNNDILIFRSYPMFILLLPCLFFFNKKIIFDTRGLFFEELFDSYKIKRTTFYSMIFTMLEKALIRRANSVICVSSAQGEYYESLQGGTVKTKVIFNGSPKMLSVEKASQTKVTIGYVGSLIEWHMPERMATILLALQDKGFDFEFHCITRDIEKANKYFSKIEGAKIYSRNFRNEPLSFDLGLCMIKESLSKEVCFPVKYSEYVSSGTNVLFSNNVKVCNELYLKYGIGIPISLSDSNELICNAIMENINANREGMGDFSIPRELTFANTIDNYLELINDV